ncbi:leucine-rich repeat domain-containing protein [Acinetobacter bereziniae]|uniref:leucine-rich repeat domain-containing protein n=1 Tax=Acinetobacter bereziniae TaxID=106648 RepID=UPI00300B7B4D
MLGKNIDILTIYEGVKVISDQAFYDNAISFLNIPNSVEHIGQNSFSDNQITTLEIGSGLKMLGNYAFARNKLTTITLHATTPPEIFSNSYPPFDENPTIQQILVPASAFNAYKNHSYWSTFGELITAND